MRVLMTADAVGGVWSYALELCRALDRHGVEVTLAVLGPAPGEAQRDEVRACRNVRLVARPYRLEWMPEPWEDVAAAGAWLLELQAAVRPDVVHVNGYAHAALPWPVPCLVAAHSCVCSWWHAVHGCAAPAEWDRYRRVVRNGLHAAQLVVAPTRALLDELSALYGASVRSLVIPNGVATARLPLGARDAFGRYARTAALPRPVVLAAGRLWDPSKNMETLAQAAPHIRWPVYVAGSARHPAGGRRALDGLHHLGNLSGSGLRQWYTRASVFVHPAVYEPFGLAPLEAALHRTALVLADIPTLREVWGDAAIYVPPRDAAGLAAAVNRLAAEPMLLTARAEAALRRARQFTARRMAAAYLDAYRTVTGRAARDVGARVTACVS